MDKFLAIHPWKIIEEDFVSARSEVSESIFSIGNGFMGVRGNFEEGYSGPSLPGSYYAGIYYPDKTRVGWWKNGYPEYFAKVLNGLSWIGLKIKANGKCLDLAKSKINNYTRTLDMKNGLLSRSFDWDTEVGVLSIHFERWCSFDQKHLGALQVKISSQNYQGELEITSLLDFNVWNKDTNYDEQFWENFESVGDNDCIGLMASTKKTEFSVCGMSKIVYNRSDWKYRQEHSSNRAAECISGHLGSQDSICIQKLVALSSTLYSSQEAISTNTQSLLQGYLSSGYDTLKSQHIQAWLDQWKSVDIIIEGDDQAQQGIRFNIFQLLQTYRGDDARLNIGPKGFTGEKYGGSTYWDTEAYCLPFYYHACGPQVAKQLLMYRYNHLDKAKENAAKLGFSHGAALYPMVTMTGEECHNEWEITFEEIHRNGAIAYAIHYYLQATADEKYVIEYGLPVLIGIARFWNQRITYSEAKKQYVILGVTGPNEYENNVNNNWYTNYISVWCLQFAMDIIEKSKAAGHWESLAKTIDFQCNEINDWQEKINNMYFPMDHEGGLFLQQDGFLDKEIIPVSQIPSDEYPIHKHWSWDRILRSCFIKQADVLQGLYFFENDFSLQQIKRNYEYYEPLTVHESSLSPCVHSIIAAKLGKIEKSYELYLRTARLDLDNYNHDTNDGLHITSMAGTWMSVVYGFGGVRMAEGQLSLSPCLPDHWSGYRFKIIHQKAILEIKVNPTIVSVDSNTKMTITVYNNSYDIFPGQITEINRVQELVI